MSASFHDASFHEAYAASGMRGNAFLELGAGDPDTRRARVELMAQRRIAAPLIDSLRSMNPAGRARANVDALAAGKTVCVVTGQQVGLFLGPLYTLAKAASAIAWAKRIERETGVRTVPLFWLQTEDHDFQEIQSVSVPRSGTLPPIVLTLHDEAEKRRVPVAERRLGPDIDRVLEELDHALAGSAHGEETIALVRRFYRRGARLDEAFSGLLVALFSESGLVVLNPRQEPVTRLFAPVIARAFREAAPIDAALATRKVALERAGYAEQIHTRPGTPLPFVHDNTGERQRVHDAAGLAERVLAEPMRFSTSALLRPIAQDTLLPTALYVGGPAEIDYFAQASALYPLFDLPPPLVALRARLRLITPRIERALSTHGLTLADVDAGADNVRARLVAPAPDGPNAQWLAELDARLDTFARGPIDAALARKTARTRSSIHASLERLSRAHQHTRLERERALADTAARILSWLSPDGHPQERVHSFPAFAARVGASHLIERITAAIDPLPAGRVDVWL